MTYEITKTFIDGPLKGITITERTTVRWQVGQIVAKPIGGSPYRIDAVKVGSEFEHVEWTPESARRRVGGTFGT